MARLLVINADDLGYDPAVSRGIIEAMRFGVVSSTTLMVNTPYSEKAARQARRLAVGLHLNLSRGRPLFARFPKRLLAGGELSESRALELSAELVMRETSAQLERFQILFGASPTHLDVHRHLHRHPRVLEGVAEMARRHHIPVRSLDSPMRERLRSLGVATNAHFIGEAGEEPYWTQERLQAELEALDPNLAAELMCHPGYLPSVVKTGYGAQREVELQTFLSPFARALIDRLRIELVDYRELTGV
jgi:chitin disaccharide deacetylase